MTFCRNDFDDVLLAVADELSTDTQLEALGKALKFSMPKIQRYQETNMKGPNVTNRGTIAMLRDWRQNVDENEERHILRSALLKAELRRIASKHLREDDKNS